MKEWKQMEVEKDEEEEGVEEGAGGGGAVRWNREVEGKYIQQCLR